MTCESTGKVRWATRIMKLKIDMRYKLSTSIRLLFIYEYSIISYDMIRHYLIWIYIHTYIRTRT